MWQNFVSHKGAIEIWKGRRLFKLISLCKIETGSEVIWCWSYVKEGTIVGEEEFSGTGVTDRFHEALKKLK